MSKRVCAYTVVLEHDFKDEDADNILNAIRMVRGVASVVPEVMDVQTYFAIETARQELGKKLIDIVYPPKETK